MIRLAKQTDADQIAPLIIQAMGELAQKFANSDEPKIITELFEHFIKLKHNQYSYENTLVFVDKDQIFGSVNAYDGAELFSLRQVFLDYLAEHRNLRNFNPEIETQSGEFYIDCISVKQNAQGRGIGKQLITAAIEWAIKLGHAKIGLLVDKDNTGALNLYQKMGFNIENNKTFMGADHFHMTYLIGNNT